MTLVMIWWFVSARKWFKGPRVNVNHKMLGRPGTVVDGESPSKEKHSSGSQDNLQDLKRHTSTNKVY